MKKQKKISPEIRSPEIKSELAEVPGVPGALDHILNDDETARRIAEILGIPKEKIKIIE